MAAMVDIHGRVPQELANSLALVAEATERTKSYHIFKAVENYIREQIEDIQDAEEALASMNDPNRVLYSSEEMDEILRKRLEVERGL